MDDEGFGKENLCNAPENKVADLADELISCQLPEPITLGPSSSPADKKQHEYQKKLRDSVIQVQKHGHTDSCRKYNGSCRYKIPRFPVKRTVLAKPLDVGENLTAAEYKEKFEKNNEKMKEFTEILTKAKIFLDDENIEKIIEREVVGPSFREELQKTLEEIERGEKYQYDENTEKGIIRKIIKHFKPDGTDVPHDVQMLTKIVSEMHEKKVEIPNDEDAEMDAFCRLLDTTYEKYEEALSTTKNGKILFIKRRVSERMINNYNREMLYAWDANMDIQLALDPFAVVTYIVSYINKEETQITKFMSDALKSAAKENAKEKLKKLKLAYFTHRQVGASEAVYRILPNLKLKDSNITCIFVMTGFPENRSSFFKKVGEQNENSEVENLDVDSDDDFEDNEIQKKTVKVEGREGNFHEQITIHERYAARPKSTDPSIEGRLEKMCLAQFATSYTPTAKLPKTAEMGQDGCSKELSSQTLFNSEICLPKYILLTDGLGYMRLRAYPSVCRIHNSKKKDDHEQHYSELVLFAHWRDEIIEFHKDFPEDCVNEYENRKKDEIFPNRKEMFPGDEIMELAEYSDLIPEHIHDYLDCQGEQNNEDDIIEGCEDDPEFETFGYMGNLNNNPEKPAAVQFDDCKYKKISLYTNSGRNQMCRRLVPEQMNILRKIAASCKTIVKAKKDPKVKPKPVRLIVHGGSGNGIYEIQTL